MAKSFRPVASAPPQDQIRHVPFTSLPVRMDTAFRSFSNAMETTTVETCRTRFTVCLSLVFRVSSSVAVEDVFQDRGNVTMTTTAETCRTNRRTAHLPLVPLISFSVITDDALLSDGSVIEMTIATMAAMKETALERGTSAVQHGSFSALLRASVFPKGGCATETVTAPTAVTNSQAARTEHERVRSTSTGVMMAAAFHCAGSVTVPSTATRERTNNRVRATQVLRGQPVDRVIVWRRSLSASVATGALRFARSATEFRTASTTQTKGSVIRAHDQISFSVEMVAASRDTWFVMQTMTVGTAVTKWTVSRIQRLPLADTVLIISTRVKGEAVSTSRGSVMGSPTVSGEMTRITARMPPTDAIHCTFRVS